MQTWLSSDGNLQCSGVSLLKSIELGQRKQGQVLFDSLQLSQIKAALNWKPSMALVWPNSVLEHKMGRALTYRKAK